VVRPDGPKAGPDQSSATPPPKDSPAQYPAIPAPKRPLISWADDEEESDEDIPDTSASCGHSPEVDPAKAERRRQKNRRKRLARAIKRRQRTEQATFIAEQQAQRQLAPLKKALATATAMVASASKKLEAALTQLDGGKRPVVGRSGNENSDTVKKRKKKKYYAPKGKSGAK
jgi:hypothetical protein